MPTTQRASGPGKKGDETLPRFRRRVTKRVTKPGRVRRGATKRVTKLPWSVRRTRDEIWDETCFVSCPLRHSGPASWRRLRALLTLLDQGGDLEADILPIIPICRRTGLVACELMDAGRRGRNLFRLVPSGRASLRRVALIGGLASSMEPRDEGDGFRGAGQTVAAPERMICFANSRDLSMNFLFAHRVRVRYGQ
jgi:hypothetical protein